MASRVDRRSARRSGSRGGERKEKVLVITVDGPAAAGKSTVARALAARLGFDYLDTGAMYRAATWRALGQRVPMDDAEALARCAAEAEIDLLPGPDGARVFCDGREVTAEIRRPEVTANVFRVADQPPARAALIEQQRRYAQGRNLVSEGRDQGTEVFPDAEVKFYLDASIEARAARRMADLVRMGIETPAEDVRRQLSERDARDRARPVGALKQSDDMIAVDSTCMSVDQVVSKMMQTVAARSESGTGARRCRQGP